MNLTVWPNSSPPFVALWFCISIVFVLIGTYFGFKGRVRLSNVLVFMKINSVKFKVCYNPVQTIPREIPKQTICTSPIISNDQSVN